MEISLSSAIFLHCQHSNPYIFGVIRITTYIHFGKNGSKYSQITNHVFPKSLSVKLITSVTVIQTSNRKTEHYEFCKTISEKLQYLGTYTPKIRMRKIVKIRLQYYCFTNSGLGNMRDILKKFQKKFVRPF